MAVILFMGKVGGAHLNPVVSLAFALRSEFPWRKVPGYVLAQVAGGLIACLFLWAAVGRPSTLSATIPATGLGDFRAMLVEAVLTLGLVSVILGTASSAQNVGGLSAVAVGAYIALAGLWSSPLSGASMNPVRSFAPDLIRGDLTHTWVYVVGPVAGALLAVLFAVLLRGRGGDPSARRSAEGDAPAPARRASLQSHQEVRRVCVTRTRDRAGARNFGVRTTRVDQHAVGEGACVVAANNGCRR